MFISNRRPFLEPIIRVIRPDVVITPSDEPSREMKSEFASHFRAANPDIELIMRDRASFRRRHSSTRRIVEKVRLMVQSLLEK